MVNQYPWKQNTTPNAASQGDPRYETPAGAQLKVDNGLKTITQAVELPIQNESVVERHIRSENVSTRTLAQKAVTRDKIATGAVGFQELDPSLFTDINNPVVEAKFQQIDEQLADITLNAKTQGAKGDGVTDDWAALQNLFNYSYDNGYKVYFPEGVYLTSKPLVIYGHSMDNEDFSTTIEGAGRDLVTIVKTTNDTLTTGDYAGIDAIIIIGNELTRTGTPITNIYSNQSVAQKIYLSQLTFKSTAPSAVDHGIYSFGIYFSKFFNIGFIDTDAAMTTTRYNCFSTYERLEIHTNLIGLDFLTPIGGNTTMNIIDVHLSGVNISGFKIKGRAVITNCSTDGGLLLPYYFIEAKATLINCSFESPVATGYIEATSNSKIVLLNCGCEMQMSAGSIGFKATVNSTIRISDTRVVIANRSGFPSTSPGRLLSADKTSRVFFDNYQQIGLYDVDSFYSISMTEKMIVVDKNNLLAPYHTYIPYVSGSVTPPSYNTASVTVDNTNKYFTFQMAGAAGNGFQSLFFDPDIRFDEYSRIYMKATVDFVNASGNNCTLRVQNTFRSGVFVGTPTTFVASDDKTVDGVDAEYWIDISNLYGNYYVEVILTNLATVNIKEISLLK